MRQFAYGLVFILSLGLFAWGCYLYTQAGHYVVVDHAQLPRVPSQVIHYEDDIGNSGPELPRTSLWNGPKAQDYLGQWVYDLFTPPSIWRDPVAGSLKVQPWEGEQGPSATQFKLVACDRNLFRVQLEGFADAPSAGTPKLLFVDVPSGRRMVGHVGDCFTHTHVRILAFNPEELTLRGLPRSTPEKNPTVIVLDEMTGEEITLKQKDPCYQEGWVVQISEGGETIEFHEIGEAKPSREGALTLKQVDFERATVTLEYHNTKTGDTELAVLQR